ncbi:hypothetical protein DFQ28_004615, partial [Apophysomyces sp. BC1034]
MTAIVSQLQAKISSMEEIIKQHATEKAELIAHQNKMMSLFLELNAKIDALTTSKGVNKTTTQKKAVFGEGSSTANSIHAPNANAAKESYAAKAAKAAKADNKKLPRKQTKARAPTVDTMKRILTEPTGPSSYRF